MIFLTLFILKCRTESRTTTWTFFYNQLTSLLPHAFISLMPKSRATKSVVLCEEEGGVAGKDRVLGDICNLPQCETTVHRANKVRNAEA